MIICTMIANFRFNIAHIVPFSLCQISWVKGGAPVKTK